MIPIYLISNDQPFRVDYLVIGGGGGGGFFSQAGEFDCDGAGGGGGGLVSSVGASGGAGPALDDIRFIGGQQVTIIVGAGGAVNAKGTNSSIGELIAIGGGNGQVGRGGTVFVNAIDGGSGGGAYSDSSSPGLGTTNQGFNGGNGGGGGANYPSTFRAGGGGGAGEVGNTDGTGFGGDGITNSITGSSLFYSGGGGGSQGGSGTVFPGGDGGGGNGSRNGRGGSAINAQPGQVNTGGGGGGGCYYNNSGVGTFIAQAAAGGSGLVILRYPSGARIIDRIDPGLVYDFSDDGTFKRYVFTAGSGNLTF